MLGEVLAVVLLGVLLNTIIGAAVCASLDTEDRVFYRWYKEPLPFHGLFCFLVLSLWPIMAYFMIKYKNDKRTADEINTSRG